MNRPLESGCKPRRRRNTGSRRASAESLAGCEHRKTRRSKCMWHRQKDEIVAIVAGVTLLSVAPNASYACGPEFPNQLLVMGDEAVLEAPVATFRIEVGRIRPNTVVPFRSVVPGEKSDWIQLTSDIDLRDLQAVAGETKIPARVVSNYAQVRE